MSEELNPGAETTPDVLENAGTQETQVSEEAVVNEEKMPNYA